MNRFEFNTDLMRWDKYTVFSNSGFNVMGVSISFTNAEYLKQCLPILKNLGNNNFKIMFILPQAQIKQTFILEVTSVIGVDIPNNTIDANATLSNVKIQGLLRCQGNNLPEINNMWMYILYE